MQRTFNYTDRVRLRQQDVRFSLKPEGRGWSFDAVFEFDGYELPGESLVFVEAYRQTTWMRWPWGTVGALQPPVGRALAEFDSPDDVLFRVRVTSPGTLGEPHGLLLAEADRVRLRAPEDLNDPRTPLLPVVPSHDLGDLLWRIDFEDHPRLLINANAGDYKQIGLEPGFVAVVYPAALREVLERILRREQHRDFDDPEHPLSRWLRFAVEVLGVGEPPLESEGEDADDEWIASAVAAFARKHGLLEKFRSFWSEEASR